MNRIAIRVGTKDADILGNDHRALQSAVDYVAQLGGGLVEIGTGVYEMGDSLHLRSNVAVRGQGEETVLRKCDGIDVPLVLDGDFGEEQITVVDPTPLQVGMGVNVRDDSAGGFHTTVATLLWQDGNTFGLSTPLLSDCMVARNASASTAFPVVSGYHVACVRVENLTIDGNRENNPYLNGCRGAGIFLYRAHGTVIERCIVRRYHGDGISFQQSNDVTVTNCLVEGCSHLGYHPGSGSQRPTLRRNRAVRNGDIGIFLCWRVRHGLFEENEIVENGRFGISIGHKDTDNLFRGNRIVNNGKAGIYFRDETEPMAGHRNRIEGNAVLGNEECGLRIDGATHDIVIVGNRFGDDRQPQPVHISVGERATRIVLSGNRFEGNGLPVENTANATAIIRE